MQKNPGGRASVRQRLSLVFRDAPAPQRLSRNAASRIEAGTQPIYHDKRNQFGNPSPLLPTVEGTQIVGSHDPDETDLATVRYEISDGVIRIAYTDLSFDTGNVDAWMSGDLARGRDSLVEWGKLHRVFERIAGRHQPPHPIEREPFQCQHAGSKVRLVGRVEGATEQSDSLAGIMWWNAVIGIIRNGSV